MYKIKSLNRLQRLVRTLDYQEVQSTKKFLDFYSSTNKKTQVKELLNQSIKNEPIDRKRYRNNEVLRKVSEELSKKIYESLILDNQIEKTGNYSLQIRTIVKLHKLYIQALVLSEKGLEQNALKLIDRIINTALKFELYDELLKALYWKRNYYSDKSKETYDQINNEIYTYESHRAIKYLADQKIADLLHKKNVIDIIDSIEELNFYNNKLKSTYIEFVITYLQFLFNEHEKTYEACRRLLYKMLLMVKSSPSLNSKTRLLNLQLDLVRNHILLEEYIEAKKLMKAIESNIIIGSKQFIRSKELAYYNAYLNNNYHSASKYIISLFNTGSNLQFYKNKWYLMLVLSEYQLANYESVEKYLVKISFAPTEKLLNFEKRILEIFNSIRLLNYDYADKLIEATRKYLVRHVEFKEEKRIKLIGSLLVALRSKSYNFQVVKQRCKKKIAELHLIESERPIKIETMGLFKVSKQFQ